MYILLYVRTSHWSPLLGDGEVTTPYARDAQSVQLTSHDGSGDSIPSYTIAVGTAAGAVGSPAPEGVAAGATPDVTDSGSSLGLPSVSPPAREGVADEHARSTAGSEEGVVGAASHQGKRSACGDAGAIPTVTGPADAGQSRRVRSRRSASATEASSAATAVDAREATSEPIWRNFTPAVVDERLCLARTWAQGQGGQCARRRPEGKELCAVHESCDKWRQHGLVTGPFPEKKLAEFLKAGRAIGVGTSG